MMSLPDDKQAAVINGLNTTSRYLDDILNINNVYFDNMVSQVYPSKLQLNKANTFDTEASFLDLHFFQFLMILFRQKFLINDGDVPRSTSYGVHISHFMRFARASSHVTDFNTHNKL